MSSVDGVRTVVISPSVAVDSGLSDIAYNTSLINGNYHPQVDVVDAPSSWISVAKDLVVRHSRILAITAAVAAFAWVVTSSSSSKSGRRSKKSHSKKSKKASSSLSSNTPSRKKSAKSTPTHTPPLSRSAATSSPNSPLFNLKSGGVRVTFKNASRKVSSSSALLHDDDDKASSIVNSSEIPATTATPSLATTPATLQDSSASVDVRLACPAATKVAVNSSSSPSPLPTPPKKSVVTTTATTTDNESATALLLQGNALPPTPPADASTDEDTEPGFWDDESPFANDTDKTPTSDTVSSATSATIAAKPVVASSLLASPSHAVKSASPLGQSVITAGIAASACKQPAVLWFKNSAELSVHDSKQLVFKVDAQREPPFPLAYSTTLISTTTKTAASPEPVTIETKALPSAKPETLPSSMAKKSYVEAPCKPSLSWFTETEASQMPTLVSAEREFPFSMAYSTAITKSSTTAPSNSATTAAAPVKKQIVRASPKKEESFAPKTLSWFTIVESSVTYASQLSSAEREFPFPMEYSNVKKKDQESSMQEEEEEEESSNVEVVITTEKSLLLLEETQQESLQSTYELASEELVEESVETEGTALEEEEAAEFENLTAEVEEKGSAVVALVEGGYESEMASPDTAAASLNPAVVEFVPISALEMSGGDLKFNLEVPEFVPGEAVVSEDQFGLAVPDFVPSQSSDGIVFYPGSYDAVYNPYNNQQILDPVYDASYDQQQNVDPLYNSQQVADLVNGSIIEAPNGDAVFNPYAADAIYNPYERPPAIFDGVNSGGFDGNQYDVNGLPYYSPGTAAGYSLMVDPIETYPEGGYVGGEYLAAEYNQQQPFNYSKQRRGSGKRHSHNGRGNGSQRHSTSSNHHNYNHNHSRSSTNNDGAEYTPQAYTPRGSEHRSKSHQHSRSGTAGSGTGGDAEYNGNSNGYRTRGGLSHKSSTTSLHSNGTGGGSSGQHSRSHSHRNGRRGEEEQHHHAPTLADFIKVAVKKEAKQQVNHGVNSDNAAAAGAGRVSEAARIDDVTIESGGDAESGVPIEGATTAAPAASSRETKKSPHILNRDVVKCIYGSSCVNSKCPYFHPTEVCKFFPNCKYGANCMFVHKPVATTGSSATTTTNTTTTTNGSATE